jgi:hypothetical protein
MLVEALFWFHPLVWWLGARLIAERERACDENVVETGNEAQVYAESILKVCRFYAIPPPPLAAAVLSADLDDRLHGIMRGGGRAELSGAQKILIGVWAALVLAWPLAAGWSGAMRSEIAKTPSAKNSAGPFQDVALRQEGTMSRAGCENHFLAMLQGLEKDYGQFAPLYPERARNDQDRLPISLTWKNGLGVSRYQEATVYMREETAHVWDARRRLDGRTIDAAASWSAESESGDSVCLTEIDVKA